MRLHRFALTTLLLAAGPAGATSATGPVDEGALQLRLSTTLAVPRLEAQSNAPSPTFTQRTQQPVDVLQATSEARERELLQAMQVVARQQRTTAELEARLARARAEREMNPLVAGLLIALAAAIVAVSAFWWRGRRAAPAQAGA